MLSSVTVFPPIVALEPPPPPAGGEPAGATVGEPPAVVGVATISGAKGSRPANTSSGLVPGLGVEVGWAWVVVVPGGGVAEVGLFEPPRRKTNHTSTSTRTGPPIMTRRRSRLLRVMACSQ